MRAQARLDHRDVPADATVVALQAHEGLSTLFDVTVDFLVGDADLDLAAMLWSTACVTLTPIRGGTVPRSFHGVIEEAAYLGFDDLSHRYRLRLRPSVHGLAYRVRTRIFQELNVVDIVKKVFEDAGIAADSVRWQTEGNYPVRTYCTQWKESELAFVLRLLEDEGIFYWFEHTDVDHVLCLGDSPSVHTSIEGDPIVPMRGHVDQDIETLWSPILETKLVHDGYRSRDWFFETPAAPLDSEDGGDGVRLRYEYPGGYEEQPEGDRLAAVHVEEAWRDRNQLRAQSDCLRLVPGRKLEIVDAAPELFLREYLLTSVEHRLDVGELESGSAAQSGAYTAQLRAIPADVPYRPARVTPKPLAPGLESAVVTGPSGEEIHVDEYGRIKVHFYWDRENPVDDTASCWIRFQQINTSGAMILPRIGWEVHVAFVDGDPDRPIALHKAYNQETMPPYGLPANKTQSALQSSTSPGGGSTNEIRMQDGNGGMDWFLHSSKDLNVVVANDENETVGVDVSESVGATFTSQVGGDETGTVGANQSISVSANSATETAGSKSVSVGGNDDWGITGSFGFTTGGSRTDDIGGLMNVLANSVAETFNANHTRTVGAVQAIISATSIGETVGGSKTENVSAAKAVITPKEYAEAISGTKTLNSGAVTVQTGGDVTYGAKGAIALTAAGVIDIKCGADCMITGSQVRVTSGSALLKGGGGKFKLGGSITIDATKFGGSGGPQLKIKGNINYK